MISRTNRQILIGLLVLLVLGGTITGTVAAQGPSMSISVAGTSVSDGGSIDVENNPVVDMEITASSTIEVVEVRVNGNIVESYEVGSQSFSQSVRLELDSGENEIEVLANADQVSTFTATIVKDDTRPRVAYTSPFQTDRYAPAPDSVSVSDASVTLSGDLYDATSVRDIRIERRYTYQYAGTSETDRSEYRIQDPGDSFSQELLLGDGENTLIVTYTDEHDNTRQNEITVTVVDETSPQLDLSLPERSGAETIQVQGTVSDNVKVNSVTIEAADGTTTAAVQSTHSGPEQSRLSVDISEQVSLNEGDNQITVRATDAAGNTVEREFNVVYDPNAAPRVTINQQETTVEGDSINVRGRVDSGRISGVTIESINTESGETVDLARVYNSEQVTNRVDIDTTLSLADTTTEIRVLVTDADGEQHETSFRVEPGSGSVSTAAADATPSGDSESDSGAATQSDSDAQSQGDGSSTSGGESAAGDSGPGIEEGIEIAREAPGFTPITALIAIVVSGLWIARRR